MSAEQAAVIVAFHHGAYCQRVYTDLMRSVSQGHITLDEAWAAIERAGDDQLWNSFCDAIDRDETR